MSCRAVPCTYRTTYTVPYQTAQNRTLPYHTVPHRVVPCRAESYGTLPYGQFQMLNLEKWAQTLGDLSFKMAF